MHERLNTVGHLIEGSGKAADRVPGVGWHPNLKVTGSKTREGCFETAHPKRHVPHYAGGQEGKNCKQRKHLDPEGEIVVAESRNDQVSETTSLAGEARSSDRWICFCQQPGI